MFRFVMFVFFALAFAGEYGYSQAESLEFVFVTTAMYATLGLIDRPLRRWWSSTRVHKALTAWLTRAIDGTYGWFRSKKS